MLLIAAFNYRILIGIVSFTNSIMEFEIFFLSSVPIPLSPIHN